MPWRICTAPMGDFGRFSVREKGQPWVLHCRLRFWSVQVRVAMAYSQEGPPCGGRGFGRSVLVVRELRRDVDGSLEV